MYALALKLIDWFRTVKAQTDAIAERERLRDDGGARDLDPMEAPNAAKALGSVGFDPEKATEAVSVANLTIPCKRPRR